jgi:alanyl-tRNA synthetase
MVSTLNSNKSPSVSKVPTMSAHDIRESFIEYFKEKGHTHVASAPLLTRDDPTLMFVNSGMVQFKEVFAGHETRPYTRATTCQKSLRVSGKHNDFEQIGLTRRHHTFFEMLGNFSFGDYFKEDAIAYAWEFLTEKLCLPKERLWVTVHHSDQEAEGLWRSKTDVAHDRIVHLGDDTNLWAAGDSGPWGYCSEIFFCGELPPEQQTKEEFLKDDGRFLEIWNLVFMQYLRSPEGKDSPLPKPCIDTGAGFERLVSVVQGKRSNYDVEPLRSVIQQVEKLAGIPYVGIEYDGDDVPSSDIAMRVIADHARAAAFLIADSVIPGNEGEGYVLRRIIRRAIRFGQHDLHLTKPFFADVVASVIAGMSDVYPELDDHRNVILDLSHREEMRFRETLKIGLEILMKEVASLNDGDTLNGEVAFKLYDTYGFPLDLTIDVLRKTKLGFDKDGFDSAMARQKERSRSQKDLFYAKVGGASIEGHTEFQGYNDLTLEGKLIAMSDLEGDGVCRLVFDVTPFYAEMGGQVGDEGTIIFPHSQWRVTATKKSKEGTAFVHFCTLLEGAADSLRIGDKAMLMVDALRRVKITRNHSAVHLVHAGLRKVLGAHISQRGSYLDDTRFRFDFSHFKQVTREEISEINAYINEEVRANRTARTDVLPLEEAKKEGAIAAFDDKYGDMVRVVTLGPDSKEFCGGTHVKATGEIGLAFILSEGSVSSGVRRIEGAAGETAYDEVVRLQERLKTVADTIKCGDAEIESKTQLLVQDVKTLQRTVRGYEEKMSSFIAEGLQSSVQRNRVPFVMKSVEATSPDALQLIAQECLKRMGSGVVVLGAPLAKSVAIKVSKGSVGEVDASKLAKQLGDHVGARGGGRPDSAVVGGLTEEKINELLNEATRLAHLW